MTISTNRINATDQPADTVAPAPNRAAAPPDPLFLVLAELRLIRQALGRAPAPAPEVLRGAGGSALCGRSEASWWRDSSAGRVPRPLKQGGGTYWRRGELLAWIEAGCPTREAWERLRGRQGAGGEKTGQSR